MNSFCNRLGLEIANFFAFCRALFRCRDKVMRMILLGTVKRQVKVYFFRRQTIKYIKEHRKGNCNGCGVCCQFIRKCPYLTDENRCGIYEKRHRICRYYPVSSFDTQLISKISGKKCGFYFED